MEQALSLSKGTTLSAEEFVRSYHVDQFEELNWVCPHSACRQPAYFISGSTYMRLGRLVTRRPSFGADHIDGCPFKTTTMIDPDQPGSGGGIKLKDNSENPKKQFGRSAPAGTSNNENHGEFHRPMTMTGGRGTDEKSLRQILNSIVSSVQNSTVPAMFERTLQYEYAGIVYDGHFSEQCHKLGTDSKDDRPYLFWGHVLRVVRGDYGVFLNTENSVFLLENELIEQMFSLQEINNDALSQIEDDLTGAYIICLGWCTYFGGSRKPAMRVNTNMSLYIHNYTPKQAVIETPISSFA
ncbi:MAG: hypothetical protein ACI4NJ_12025 [Cellvibrio sp.]